MNVLILKKFFHIKIYFWNLLTAASHWLQLLLMSIDRLGWCLLVASGGQGGPAVVLEWKSFHLSAKQHRQTVLFLEDWSPDGSSPPFLSNPSPSSPPPLPPFPPPLPPSPPQFSSKPLLSIFRPLFGPPTILSHIPYPIKYHLMTWLLSNV